MNYLDVWCNIRDSHKDLEFASAVAGYLDFLQGKGLIAGWILTRRKFGFGPQELGEFHVRIGGESLAQLDDAFSLVATRDGEIEKLHAKMYVHVTDLKSALYRDFPDDVRVGAKAVQSTTRRKK